MLRSTFALAIAAGLALTLSGCATSRSDVISRHDAQRMSTVVDGTVLTVRAVTIDGSQSGMGATAGGVVGAIAGSSIGGRRDSAVGGVLGAVAGALAGNAIERNTTREESQEILIQLRNGERRAIVQAKGGETLQPGDAVIIVSNGSKVRVTRAPVSTQPVVPQMVPQVVPSYQSVPTPVPGTRS
ncbi:MAG: glycine zipper 2TM domain-containing protein [Betaproteobacteria bacterium]|nr:glycine zipper 2TM domain-containing protein [Betaproteobacteria bacterium]